MRKIMLLLLAALGTAALLAGCDREKSVGDITMLEIRKNGEILHTIAEDFAESYYDLEELKGSVESQIADYNAGAGDGAITLDSAEVEEGRIRMLMTFKSAENYVGFYRQALFCGTVKDAFNAGYDLDIRLRSVDGDGAEIGRQDILEMGEKHILVIREQIRVRTFGNILYVSSDVEPVEGSREADVTDKENLSYIIFE